MSEAQIFKFYKRNKSRISRCRTMFKNFMKMTKRESDQLWSSLLLWFHLKSGQTLITLKAEIKLRFKYIRWVTFYIHSRLLNCSLLNSYVDIIFSSMLCSISRNDYVLMICVNQCLKSINRYRGKRPNVDASFFDSTLSHTRRSDASKKKRILASTFGQIRLWTSFESLPVSGKVIYL